MPYTLNDLCLRIPLFLKISEDQSHQSHQCSIFLKSVHCFQAYKGCLLFSIFTLSLSQTNISPGSRFAQHE